MGLSMNAAKTKLLFLLQAGSVANITVEVDRSIIHPGNVIELLGVKYDRRLSTGPHIKALLAAVRQRASVVSRLANHLPRGEYLQQLSYGLVVGKFSHALAAVARPSLEQEDNASVVWSGIQVALNNVARSITGTRRRDHVRIEDLLVQAGLESANRMVVKAIAAKTWGCFHSDNGRDGSRNHIGRLLFSDKRTATAKTTWSAKTSRSRSLCGGVTPSSPTRPTCGTGRPRFAGRLRRRRPNRWHQTWRVSHRFSPAGHDSPPAALWGVPCGSWGVSCGTWGVSPATSTESVEKHGTSSSARSPFLLFSTEERNCCSTAPRGISR
jgi:hypothetical protein